MATDEQYALLYNKKLLPIDQMGPKLLTYLLNQVRNTASDTFPTDATIGSTITPVTATGNNRVNIGSSQATVAVTGTGKRIVLGVADSRFQSYKVPPNAAAVYGLAIEQSDVENGIEVNPRTGAYQYSSFIESPGRKGNPGAVINNGDGTLTLSINTICEASSDHSGQLCRVWLTDTANAGPGPQSPNATIAIQNIAVVYSSPNNNVTIPNWLGQTAPSTSPLDYSIQLIGPTCKLKSTEDLQFTAGAFFLGYVTSVASGSPITVIDTSAQNVVSIGLADVDTHIQNLEANLNTLEASTVVSGMTQVTTSGLNFTVAAGTAIMAGKLVSLAQTVVACTNNATVYIYVDPTTLTYKMATTPAALPALPLFLVTTLSSAITKVDDMRRLANRRNSQGFITVGGAGCDFLTLEGAIDWLTLNRGASSAAEQVTAEICVQNNLTMTKQVTIPFACTIRGAGLDGTAVGTGAPKVKVITPTALVAFTHGTAALPNVKFQDIYFSIPTGSAGSGFFVSGTGLTLGDDWVFDNCVFDGGKDTPSLNINTASTPAGWRFNRCLWTNGTHVSAQPYNMIVGTSGGSPIGWSWTDCRFLGETTDAFVNGVQFDQLSAEHQMSNCEFTLGGIGVITATSADQITLDKCRFKNSRGTALNLTSSGEVTADKCYFNNCNTAGASATQVIAIASTGIATIRSCRIKNWVAGRAINATAGSDHRIENNIITTTVGVANMVAINIGSANTLISGNDIDMSVGAGAGFGLAGATPINSSGVAGVRIINNKIKNCGSSGTGGTAINSGASTIIAMNTLINCRGQGISCQAADSIVLGNLVEAGMVTNTESALQLSGNNGIAVANILHAATSAFPFQIVGSPTGCKSLGNITDVAATFASGVGVGLMGGAVRRRQSNTPTASTSYTGSVTVVLATVPQPANTPGTHLPANMSLAAAVTNVDSGIRLIFSDGTTQDLLNATAGVVSTDLLGTPGVITTTTDNESIAYVQFIARNTSTTVVATLGASTYEGYVIG